MSDVSSIVTVVGAGLAGSEAALQLAAHGIPVRLVEMRPVVSTPAHRTDRFGELVCSNSFKSTDPSSAAGSLKHELEVLGSRLMPVTKRTAVPAGAALAVDRDRFAAAVTAEIEAEPLIEIVRCEASSIPGGDVIVATGPLTSAAFEGALSDLVGTGRLAFFDAAAPIVEGATIDRNVAFAASRYDKGSGADYLNCPMDRSTYEHFITELVAARRVVRREFETDELFQACQPVEEVARTGVDAPRFGALKPVGLTDPLTGTRPWAVVQLRAENMAGTAYNLVGFQTNLTFGEQRRVFSLIPGLERAEFLRFGVMHRNTYVDAPRLLDSTLALLGERRVRLAGQVTGTEGYLEAVATGLLAAINVVAARRRTAPVILPPTTALGALVAYATDIRTSPYQPMHVNWGLVPPLAPPVRGKRARYSAYAARAATDVAAYRDSHPILAIPPIRRGSAHA